MGIKELVRVVTALGLVGALLWMSGASAAAATAQAVLTPLPPAEQEPGKPLAVAARLTDGSSGRPVGNATVQFYVMTDVFGLRPMSIGEAVTDTTGRAAISYKPSWEGETSVIAKFAGNSQYTAAEAKYAFTALGPVPVHQNAKFGLEPIRAWAPLVVGGLVLTVWAILIAVVVQTVVGLNPRSVGLPVLEPISARGAQVVSQDFVDGAS